MITGSEDYGLDMSFEEPLFSHPHMKEIKYIGQRPWEELGTVMFQRVCVPLKAIHSHSVYPNKAHLKLRFDALVQFGTQGSSWNAFIQRQHPNSYVAVNCGDVHHSCNGTGRY